MNQSSPVLSPQQNLFPIDLRTLLDRTLTDFMASVNCTTIGTVNSFNSTTQTVTVAINYLRIIKAGNPVGVDVASDQYVTYPLLVNVPIVILQGGGAKLTFPIAKGDTCLVLFNDREIDTWFTYGSTTPVPPQSDRTHDLNDGFALIGVRPSTKPFSGYNHNIASLTDNSGERLAQTGMMSAYAGNTAPSGWILCQGQAISRTDYSYLFAVIGTTYGAGDGSTTFNIPNMQGNVAVGLLPSDPNFGALGASLGEQNHTLTIPEIPSHTHPYGVANSALSGTPSGSANNGGSDFVTSPTGGGGAHNNIQPSLVVNWIIKI